MAESQMLCNPRIWISYPYINAEVRDFSYLIAQLRKANIDASYDSFQLPSNTHIWERIVPRIVNMGFDGWLYVLTHECLIRKKFIEELIETAEKISLRMGRGFPMIGLVHGIAAQNVPLALRVRPCISLGDSEWTQQLSTHLKGRTAPGKERLSHEETRFSWRIHACYQNDPSMTAVEVRSSSERIKYWRFAVPKSAQVACWGQGPAGGGPISRVRFAESKGPGRHEHLDTNWFGAANTVSDTESAYAVFLGPLPEFICFGPAKSPLGPPDSIEIFRPNLKMKSGQIANL